jgi:hypothetical protein
MTDYPPAWPSPPPLPGVAPARKRIGAPAAAALVAAALIVGAAVGVAAGLLTRGSHSTTPANTAPPSSNSAVARNLYRQALAAARSSAGVHYVAVSSGGPTTQKIVGDATQDGGGQLITLNSTFGNEQFTLLLVSSGTVYFQGNTPAVEDQLGVPAAGAPSVQGKWVSVATGDGPYSVIAPGITVADQALEMALNPTSSTAITTADGTKATRIIGTVSQQSGDSGPAHLDIATDTHLPISEVSTVTASGVVNTSTATFSGWGKTTATTAPAAAVAWSTLGAAPPPGGYGSGGSQTPSATPAA